jgi:hypothetical protein
VPNRTDVHARRGRPTLRCLAADLGIPLPDLTVDLGDIRHPLIQETQRIAPGTPQGQKRILSIREPLVYRIRHSGFRGATWLDGTAGIVWLCGVERREDNSDDDAFAYFFRLHEAGHLLRRMTTTSAIGRRPSTGSSPASQTNSSGSSMLPSPRPATSVR